MRILHLGEIKLINRGGVTLHNGKIVI